MISFDDFLIKFILSQTFSADSFELAGDVYYFNNGAGVYGSVKRDESGWIVIYHSTFVEIIVNQDGGEADDLIIALDRAASLTDSALVIAGRIVDRGWDIVNHPRGSVCGFYKGGMLMSLYQKDSPSHPFIARGSRAGVNDAVVAGRGLVSW